MRGGDSDLAGAMADRLVVDQVVVVGGQHADVRGCDAPTGTCVHPQPYSVITSAARLLSTRGLEPPERVKGEGPFTGLVSAGDADGAP